MSGPAEPTAPPHLFTFLTREEFKLAFAVAFVASTDVFGSSYPLERYRTPGFDAEPSWEELIRQAVRYLGLERGYEFTSLHPHDDGRITSSHQVEPRNAAFVRILEWGSLPDVEDAIRTALAMRTRGSVDLPAEPLEDALEIVRGHLDAARKAVNPEALAEIVRIRRRVLEEMMGSAAGREAIN
jgi:hypothetical protein